MTKNKPTWLNDSFIYEPAPIPRHTRRSRVLVARIFVILAALAVVCGGLAAWVN